MEKLICIAACFASRWTEVSLKCTDWWQARADARRVCPSEHQGTEHDILFLFNLMRRLQLARPDLRSGSAPPKSSHGILFSWALEGLLLHFLASSQKLFPPFCRKDIFSQILCFADDRRKFFWAKIFKWWFPSRKKKSLFPFFFSSWL